VWLGGEVEAVTTMVEDGEAEKTVYPVLPARPVPPPPKTVRTPPPSTRKNKTCTLLLPSGYPPGRIFPSKENSRKIDIVVKPSTLVAK
jgi:hypothetical protein